MSTNVNGGGRSRKVKTLKNRPILDPIFPCNLATYSNNISLLALYPGGVPSCEAPREPTIYTVYCQKLTA